MKKDLHVVNNKLLGKYFDRYLIVLICLVQILVFFGNMFIEFKLLI